VTFSSALSLKVNNRWELNTCNGFPCPLADSCKSLILDCYVIQTELADTVAQLKTSQEHLVKALADVSRISDELLHCQQLHEQSEKQRKLLETQLKDAEAKLDAVQTETAYTSKKVVDKLEQRVRITEQLVIQLVHYFQ